MAECTLEVYDDGSLAPWLDRPALSTRRCICILGRLCTLGSLVIALLPPHAAYRRDARCPDAGANRLGSEKVGRR